MESQRITVFPDTNYFLHFKSIDQVDWCTVLGAESVMIVIAPVVLRELNTKKDIGYTKKLRQRAASALRRLDAFLDQPRPIRIRSGVELTFCEKDPSIDFKTARLNDKLADDWLVATVLEYRNEFSHDLVVVVSNDVGLRVKTGAQKIQIVKMPDDYALPDESDPIEVENRELQKKLANLQNKEPKLRLAFEDGSDHIEVTFRKPPVISEEEISQMMMNVRVANPLEAKPESYSGLDLARGGIGPADIDRHNIRLRKFYSDYEDYLRLINTFEAFKGRCFIFDLKLANDGFAPAEDIDVYLHIPDGPVVVEDPNTLPSEPKEPKPPGPLRSAIQEAMQAQVESLHETMNRLSSTPLISLPTPSATRALVPRNVSAATIRRTKSFEIHFNVGEVKHNFDEEFEPILLFYESWDAISSFTIKYRLLAGNVGYPVEDKLHFVARKT